MRDAIIVACGRSAIGKAPRGMLKHTRSDDVAAQVVRGVLAREPKIDPSRIDDLTLGCAFPEGEQGANAAKTVAFRANLPHGVAAQTVNRFCASGLQAIATAASAIAMGQSDVALAGGMESMSLVPMGGNLFAPNPYLMEHYPAAHISMGITAEKVAEKYGISREEQDAFAVASQQKAARAQREGRFDGQIIPVDAVRPGVDQNGRPRADTVVFDKDEGVRADTTPEGLASLRPAFKIGGTVTAGNSSQTSDGAAFVVMMAAEKAKELGLRPMARMLGFAVAGVDPVYMGIGPVRAIPKALGLAGKTLADMDLIELNEAFASQSIACIRELGLDEAIVNVNGGAIALGHPLGCTGAFLVVKLLYELAAREKRHGLVSMCIGGGMGAAAVFERL